MMIALTMLAESKCFEPLYMQYTPVARSYTDTACTPFRPRSPFQMSADSWAASARRAAGPVHRPSVTVAPAADPAADAFAVAARDVATSAVRAGAGGGSRRGGRPGRTAGGDADHQHGRPGQEHSSDPHRPPLQFECRVPVSR